MKSRVRPGMIWGFDSKSANTYELVVLRFHNGFDWESRED